MKRLFTPATAAIVAVALASTACTTDPQTGQSKMSKTAMYGLGAAAACGLLGAATHGSKGARNSALACGLVGAGVGAYMDYQEKQLREKLANTQIGIQRVGDQIRLSLPDNITFPVDGSSLNNRIQKPLNDVAGVLVQYPQTIVTVAGHTDSTGSLAHNQQLSEQRAQSVSSYLQARGVANTRLQTIGYGPSQPIASNNTATGRAKNRRVEILIAPQ